MFILRMKALRFNLSLMDCNNKNNNSPNFSYGLFWSWVNDIVYNHKKRVRKNQLSKGIVSINSQQFPTMVAPWRRKCPSFCRSTMPKHSWTRPSDSPSCGFKMITSEKIAEQTYCSSYLSPGEILTYFNCVLRWKNR